MHEDYKPPGFFFVPARRGVSAYNALMAMKSGESAHTCRSVDDTRSGERGNGESGSIQPGMMVLYEHARRVDTK